LNELRSTARAGVLVVVLGAGITLVVWLAGNDRRETPASARTLPLDRGEHEPLVPLEELVRLVPAQEAREPGRAPADAVISAAETRYAALSDAALAAREIELLAELRGERDRLVATLRERGEFEHRTADEGVPVERERPGPRGREVLLYGEEAGGVQAGLRLYWVVETEQLQWLALRRELAWLQSEQAGRQLPREPTGTEAGSPSGG
jgi:hypothetical protein